MPPPSPRASGSTPRRARATKPTRRRDEARALFRNAILEAAEEVIFERGFHGARIQDVAARARIAVGTVYNHFGQKEDVLRALLEERIEELLAQLAPQPGDPRAFEPMLVARLTRMLSFMALHRGFFSLASDHGLLGSATGAAREVLGPKPLRHVERFRAVLRDLVREGVEARALVDEDVALLAGFLGAAIKAVRQRQSGSGSDSGKNGAASSTPEADASLIAKLFLRGAGARR